MILLPIITKASVQNLKAQWTILLLYNNEISNQICIDFSAWCSICTQNDFRWTSGDRFTKDFFTPQEQKLLPKWGGGQGPQLVCVWDSYCFTNIIHAKILPQNAPNFRSASPNCPKHRHTEWKWHLSFNGCQGNVNLINCCRNLLFTVSTQHDEIYFIIVWWGLYIPPPPPSQFFYLYPSYQI